MKTFVTLACILMSLELAAQVFPVHVTTQLVPPYSPYLSDYTAPGAQHLMVHIRANDITLSGYECRLRLTIEGAGILLRTDPNFAPRPLILQGGGIPEVLSGSDLQEYLHPHTLLFSGISKRSDHGRVRLPEGVYRFTIEVLDYNRGTVVSNAGTATAWIILNDPPILNFPANRSTLKVNDPPNIVFSWTPRHSGSPNAAFTTSYTFRLVEVWPDNRNPNDAVLSQEPLFETTTTGNQLFYGPQEPALLPGRKYAWQVEGRDGEGRDLFKHNGRSEVFVFTYGEALAVPENFQLRWAKPTTLSMRWDAVSLTGEEVRYRLQYRPRLRRENHQWYETTTQFLEKTLYNLETNTDYEMKVRAETPSQESAYSEVQVFRTTKEARESFVCSDQAPSPPSPADSHPVFPLGVNDTLRAGGFDVLVRDVIQIDGKYTGSGMALVPWLNGARVRVTFENIRVNDRFWLTSGTIHSVWNPESRFLLEEVTPLAPGKVPEAGALDITVVAADTLIAFQGSAIAAVTTDDQGNTVIHTTEGVTHTLTPGVNYALTDETGNGYIIDEKGNIAKTTAAEAVAAAGRGKRNYNLNFSFARGDGRYGFDDPKQSPFSGHYQRLSNGTAVAWKALSSFSPDQIEGTLLSDEIDLSDVRFEAGAGTLTPMPVTSSKVNLSLQGSMAGSEEELLALYAPSDSLPEEILGKLNLVTYEPIHYRLQLVSVNGATPPAGLSAGMIAEKLGRIFDQAVVSWQVAEIKSLTVDLPETFDEGESGLFSNYTDDMKKVIGAWGGFEEHTYYLFLVDRPTDPSTLGYMPRNKQAGFVFVAPHHGDAEQFLKTIAHELGHGAFNLKHTFTEHNLPPGQTDNLMDYSTGTTLYKYQWDGMHDKGTVISLFEGDEEGESVVVTDMKELRPFANADGSFTFLAPTGVPFTLPGSTQAVFFWTNDVYSDGIIPMDESPDGALIGFTVAHQTYRYHKITGEKSGTGYKVISGELAYIDQLTRRQTNLEDAIVAFPCVEGGTLKFISRKLRFHSRKPEINHTAEGQIAANLPVEDPYDLEYATSKIYLDAALDFTYTDEALAFINDNAACFNEMVPWVIKAADVIQRYPGYYTRYKTCDPYPMKFPQAGATESERAFLLGQYYEKLKGFADELLNYVHNSQHQLHNVLLVQDPDELGRLLKAACEADFSLFTFEEREHILTVLSRGNLHDYWLGLGNNRENMVVYTLRQTPEDQYEDLLDLLQRDRYALLKLLINKTDNQLAGQDNFDRLIDAVTVLIQKTSIYETFEDDIAADRLIRWGSAEGFSEFRYDCGDWLENAGEEAITFHSSRATINYSGTGELTGVHFTTSELPYPELQVSPFDFVSLRLYNDVVLSTGTPILKRSVGEFQAVPAIYLYWMIRRKATDEMLRAIKAEVNLLLFVVGGAEIVAARTGLRLALAITDETVAAASFVLDAGPRKILEEGPNGEQWKSIFKAFDTFNLLYGSARIGQGLSDAAHELLSKEGHFHKLMNGEDWSRFPPAQLNATTDQLKKVEDGMRELSEMLHLKKAALQSPTLVKLFNSLEPQIQNRISQLAEAQIGDLLNDLGSSKELLQDLSLEMIDGWEVLSQNTILRMNRKNLITLGHWVAKGVKKEALIVGLKKSSSKQRLIDGLKTAESKFHVQVLIKDYENIPGVVKGRFKPNGSSPSDKMPPPAHWPEEADLPIEEVVNFTGKINPREFHPGRKIYRVSSLKKRGNAYWTAQRPTKIEDVIGGTAVEPEWNNFEYIHEYTVPDGIIIRAWEGKAARKDVSDETPGNFHLPGSAEQLYIPRISKQDRQFEQIVKSTPAKW